MTPDDLLNAHRIMTENRVPDKTLHIAESKWLQIIQKAKADADAIERVRFECERALEYDTKGVSFSGRDVAEVILAALEGKTE